MENLLQLLLSGLAAGSIYALVAIGFVLIYKATEVVNFAQGEMMMVGAYLCFTFKTGLGLSFLWAVPLTIICSALLGHHHLLSTGILSASFFSKKARQDEVKARAFVEQIIDFLGLQSVRDRYVFQLPFGYQKRIELGRALAMQPELLLLDEPAGGMNVEETEELAWWIMEIQKELGVTVFLVEHDMRLVMDISHRVGVLDQGHLVALGEPEEVQADPDVRRAYLGEGEA